MHEIDHEEPLRGARLDAEVRDKNLMRAIKSLPDPFRSVVIARMNDENWYQVAKDEGVTHQTIRNRHAKALRMLRHPTRIMMIHGTWDDYQRYEKPNGPNALTNDKAIIALNRLARMIKDSEKAKIRNKIKELHAKLKTL